MQSGYFATVWGDIKNSPGWFSKFVRLSLVFLVPVFGLLVALGYSYGWARDIAWNVHRPLPQKIFGNEDGRLYSRGFFLLVLSFVFSLVPWTVCWFVGFTSGASYTATGLLAGPFASGFDALIGLASFALSVGLFLFATLFVYVGAMRTSIYGNLSAGFQIEKIWSMIRYDLAGLFRVLGMSLLLALVSSVVLVALIVVFSLLFSLGITLLIVTFGSDTVSAWSVGAIIVGIFLFVLYMVAIAFSIAFAEVFAIVFVARALGYWTRQFRVDQWGGQDDPMPFEYLSNEKPLG